MTQSPPCRAARDVKPPSVNRFPRGTRPTPAPPAQQSPTHGTPTPAHPSVLKPVFQRYVQLPGGDLLVASRAVARERKVKVGRTTTPSSVRGTALELEMIVRNVPRKTSSPELGTLVRNVQTVTVSELGTLIQNVQRGTESDQETLLKNVQRGLEPTV